MILKKEIYLYALIIHFILIDFLLIMGVLLLIKKELFKILDILKCSILQRIVDS